MFNRCTLAAVNPIAESITLSGRLAVPSREHYPVAEVRRCYIAPVGVDRKPLNRAVLQVATEAFDQLNATPDVVNEAAFDGQVELVGGGLQNIVDNTHDVILPTVDTLVNKYETLQSGKSEPTIEVAAFAYNPVHSEAALLSHVQTRYASVEVRPQYRSFILGAFEPEAIIDMATVDNPHLPQQEATEWLLGLGETRIQAVWNTLFNNSRVIDMRSLAFVQLRNLPLQVDELLLAYCLCGHLINNPVQSAGESVSLEEWQEAMEILHEGFGRCLIDAYAQRARDIQERKIVIEYNAVDPLKTCTVQVLTNADIYLNWLDNGGDITVLLGAAITDQSLKYAEQLDARAQELVERWNRFYPLLKEACTGAAAAQAKGDYLKSIATAELPEALPKVDPDALYNRASDQLDTFSAEELCNPHTVFSHLVCDGYYNDRIYSDFLQSYEKHAQIHDGAPGREIAIDALLDIVADWLAPQIQVGEYKPMLAAEPVVESEVQVGTGDPAGQSDPETVVAADVGTVTPEGGAAETVDNGEGSTVTPLAVGGGVAEVSPAISTELEGLENFKDGNTLRERLRRYRALRRKEG